MSDIQSEPEHCPKQIRRWIATILAMLLPTGAALMYYRLFPGTATGNASYLAIKGFLIIWPLVTVVWILGEKVKLSGDQSRLGKSLLIGLGVGIALTAALVGLIETKPVSDMLMHSAMKISERIMDMGVAEHYLLFALVISVIHAAVEEFYWRWFVFGQLRCLLPVWAAHLLAALAFSLHHILILDALFPPIAVIFFGFSVALAGWLWSVIYHRYGSLWGAWLSHMIIDLGLMWVGWQALQAG